MSERLYGRVVGALIGVVFAIGAVRELIGAAVAVSVIVGLLVVGTIVTIYGGQYRNQRRAQLPGRHLTALTILACAAIAAAWVPGPWSWVIAPAIGAVVYAVTLHAWEHGLMQDSKA